MYPVECCDNWNYETHILWIPHVKNARLIPVTEPLAKANVKGFITYACICLNKACFSSFVYLFLDFYYYTLKLRLPITCFKMPHRVHIAYQNNQLWNIWRHGTIRQYKIDAAPTCLKGVLERWITHRKGFFIVHTFAWHIKRVYTGPPWFINVRANSHLTFHDTRPPTTGGTRL